MSRAKVGQGVKKVNGSKVGQWVKSMSRSRVKSRSRGQKLHCVLDSRVPSQSQTTGQNWEPFVPQGTRVGPVTFLFMVNDLLAGHRRVKFVDDTMTWECCHISGEDSTIQTTANETASWSLDHRMQLN